MKTLILINILVLAMGSSSPAASGSQRNTPSNEAKDLGEQELSLKKDREHLDKLREEIPEDIKRENDDLAYLLKLFENKKKKPSRIRSDFNKTIRRSRANKKRKHKKLRTEFTKTEKKKRKEFLKRQKSSRKEFMGTKPERDKSREFFSEQSAKQKEYFADQREKRKDFESQLKAQRKDADMFFRDKRKEFDDLYRAFIKEQQAEKKAQRDLKKAQRKTNSSRAKPSLSPQNQQMLNDFKKVPKGAGILLEPSKEK